LLTSRIQNWWIRKFYEKLLSRDNHKNNFWSNLSRCPSLEFMTSLSVKEKENENLNLEIFPWKIWNYITIFNKSFKTWNRDEMWVRSCIFWYLNECKIANRGNTRNFPSRLEQTKAKFKENICLEIFSRNIERFS
jgi:integrase